MDSLRARSNPGSIFLEMIARNPTTMAKLSKTLIRYAVSVLTCSLRAIHCTEPDCLNCAFSSAFSFLPAASFEALASEPVVGFVGFCDGHCALDWLCAPAEDDCSLAAALWTQHKAPKQTISSPANTNFFTAHLPPERPPADAPPCASPLPPELLHPAASGRALLTGLFPNRPWPA